MNIILIAALGNNNELGYKGELLWDLPGDLPRFKRLTMGYPIVMGRKTFESIGRALPGRTNIILTRNRDFKADNIKTMLSVPEVIEHGHVNYSENLYIIGGGEIYDLFLPYASRLELTIVNGTAPHADAHFPDYSGYDFIEIARQTNVADDSLEFDYITLVREHVIR